LREVGRKSRSENLPRLASKTCIPWRRSSSSAALAESAWTILSTTWPSGVPTLTMNSGILFRAPRTYDDRGRATFRANLEPRGGGGDSSGEGRGSRLHTQSAHERKTDREASGGPARPAALVGLASTHACRLNRPSRD